MAEDKIFGLVVGLQEAEIKHWCFNRCGNILMGALVDEQMGELAPCKTEVCPHEEGRIECGTVAEGVDQLVKLMDRCDKLERALAKERKQRVILEKMFYGHVEQHVERGYPV